AGTTRAATVHLFADFTPPLLTVLADGQPLAADARFVLSPSLTLDASDNDRVTVKLTVDGVVVAPPVSKLANGGHALTAIARDDSGNETRVDRTFIIGSNAASGGCSLTNFDPPDGASIFADSVRLSGRSGGATSVLVNGVRVAPG